MRALRKAFNREPVLLREGGSIPIVNQFKTILGADTLLLGLALLVVHLAPEPVRQAILPDRLPNEIVWLAEPGPGGGGGGGGNKMPDPPKKAELPGKEKITVPAVKPPALEITEPKPEEPKPDQTLNIPAKTMGMETAAAPGVLESTQASASQGSGSGGGAGTGTGTGIGPTSPVPSGLMSSGTRPRDWPPVSHSPTIPPTRGARSIATSAIATDSCGRARGSTSSTPPPAADRRPSSAARSQGAPPPASKSLSNGAQTDDLRRCSYQSVSCKKLRGVCRCRCPGNVRALMRAS